MSYLDKLQLINDLEKAITRKGILSQEILKKINYKFRLEWNYTSNNMEGNSLTKQETRSVMVGNITVEGKPIKDVLEMKKHDEIISTIMNIGKGDLNISESRIRDIHKGIMYEENPEKSKQIGIWKKEPNYLHNYKNERFDFAPPSEVPERMHKLINWLNTEKEKIASGSKNALHPALLAFQFHLDYVTIHPFYDGNGRTARIFTNLILISYGLPPIYIKENEKSPYYQYLADIQGYGGNPDLFYDFMADLLIRSLQIMIDAIEGKDIDEPNDWEKKLSLIKSELAGEPDVKVERNADSIKNLSKETVIPFIKKLIDKLNPFDELFSKKEYWFGSRVSKTKVINLNQIEQFIDTPGSTIHTNSSISFSYKLLGFKKNGINAFDVELNVWWDLQPFVYYFFIDQKDQNNTIIKYYHQQFTEDEFDSYVAIGANYLIEQIENRRQKRKLDLN